MTPLEAAQRLGVHETAVRTVEERTADCVVELRDGRRMLVTETVVRPFVPVVDDAAEEPDEAEEPGEPAPEKPKRTAVKRTQGKGR